MAQALTVKPFNVDHRYQAYELHGPDGQWVGTFERLEDATLAAAAPLLYSALNAMLTQFGMDEDEWSKPTFDQARFALDSAAS